MFDVVALRLAGKDWTHWDYSTRTVVRGSIWSIYQGMPGWTLTESFIIIINIIFISIASSAILHTCTPRWIEASVGKV